MKTMSFYLNQVKIIAFVVQAGVKRFGSPANFPMLGQLP
jgi:hypothetical protein